MSDYTPTTKTVLAYIRGNAVMAGATANEAQDAAVGWLASVERAAAEKALTDAADDYLRDSYEIPRVSDWLRARAEAEWLNASTTRKEQEQ